MSPEKIEYQKKQYKKGRGDTDSVFSNASRTFKLQNLSPKPGSTKSPRRVGRGNAGHRGASCGKGMRGQKSRSGTGTKPGFEGGQMPLYRRVPKLKGFNSIKRDKYSIINVSKLSDFPPDTVVDHKALLNEGLIQNETERIKILGEGILKVALDVYADAFSLSARAKIRYAGGKCINANIYKTAISLEEAVNMTFAEELQQLSIQLKKNWDSYGSESPNRTAIDNGRKVLKVLTMFGVYPDTVIPSSNGGIVICFVRNQKYADIECFNAGKMLVGMADQSRLDEEPNVMETEDSIEQLVSMIIQYLKNV